MSPRRDDLGKPRGTAPGPSYDPEAFGPAAERFARFFGTPTYLIWQTVLVAVWILINSLAISFKWDPSPFILLNLVFSTQAAYAAPLILLAQNRQADRDKATEESAARHQEELSAHQVKLLQENTDLTQRVADLTEQIERLTEAIHAQVVKPG